MKLEGTKMCGGDEMFGDFKYYTASIISKILIFAWKSSNLIELEAIVTINYGNFSMMKS